jgi:cytidine deaminase
LIDRVYGRRSWLVAGHAPHRARLATLVGLFGSALRNGQQYARVEAEKLIARDDDDPANEFGQHVRDLFPTAEFFVDTRDRADAKLQLARFAALIHGDPFITPTKLEYAMLHAQAAALRSADLSRQVGAVIVNRDGDIIAHGCNEVPAPIRGGAYWPDDDLPDKRDFQRGKDANAEMKDEIIREITARLEDLFQGDAPSLAEVKKRLSGTRVDDLTEFMRPVHAEMAALSDAAHRGVKVAECTLVCTTFPCHSCAKHLIAAGIHRVFFREPYPKSLALELHGDAIELDGEGEPREGGRVHFNTFKGLSPSRYFDMFRKGGAQRKESDGVTAKRFDPRLAGPVEVSPGASYISVERETQQVLLDLSESGCIKLPEE